MTEPTETNGAHALIRTLVACGVDTCFTNPGTSEMHFVAALDDVTEMRGVLALHENVATGAADGFARMAGRPAATLLHLGPGLGNGLGSGLMMTLGADLAPPGAIGEFLGVWRLIGDVGAVTGPLMVGIVAGAVGLSGGAWVLSVAGWLAVLTLARLVRETRVGPLDERG